MRRTKKGNVIYVEKQEKTVPFAEAVQAYRQFKLLEGRCDRHIERAMDLWMDAFGALNVNEINQSRVDDYAVAKMSHMQPNTIAKYIMMLKAVLNDAHRRGLVDSVSYIKAPKYFDERDEHLSKDEAERLLVWAIHELTPLEAMAFGTLIYTGVRVNELCKLRGNDFRHDRVVVRKKSGKTRNTRNIPYAKTYLDTFRPDNIHAAFGDNYVFTEVAGNPAAMSEYLGRLLKRGLAAIGIVRDFRVHDLRHTFAFLCGEAGMDLGDLQVLMGHAHISMTMRYRGFIKSRAYDVMTNI
jgi:integrase